MEDYIAILVIKDYVVIRHTKYYIAICLYKRHSNTMHSDEHRIGMQPCVKETENNYLQKGMAMQFFRCNRIDGEDYLTVDYSQKCADGGWWRFFALVFAVLIFLSLLVPIFFWALWTRPLRKTATHLNALW